MKTILTLYYMELSEPNKVMYLLSHKDGYKVIYKCMKDQADKQESQQNLTVLQKRFDRAQKQGKTAEEI